MQQPVVPVLPDRPRRRLPSATLLVALAALVVSLVSLGVVLFTSHDSGSACGGTEYRVIGAAQFPGSWHPVSLGYLGPMSSALLLQATSGTPAVPSPNGPAQLSLTVTCFGSSAADVMRGYHVVPPVAANPIPAPRLGDDALAFELNAATSAFQYSIIVRRGGLVASVLGSAQMPESEVQAVAAAIDRAMLATK